MKYLKKIKSLSERYFVIDKPNLVLLDATKKVLYNIDVGNVFIQHIDGRLFSVDEWNANGFSTDVANGAAVIDSRASFVVAKEDIGEKLVWSTEAVLIDGVSIGINNYSGLEDTEILVASGICPAAEACNNYIFPDGSKGYLASAGEWKVFNDYLEELIEVFNVIGGYNINSPHTSRYYWSSTQNTESYALQYSTRQGVQRGTKNVIDEYNGHVRPFKKL